MEQAAHRLVPGLTLTQLKYIAPGRAKPEELLSRLSFFNPNKETAMVRQGDTFYRWESDTKKLEPAQKSPIEGAVTLLRRDEPDTGASAIGQGSQTGICYICRGVKEQELLKREVLEVFANPHASTLERLA